MITSSAVSAIGILLLLCISLIDAADNVVIPLTESVKISPGVDVQGINGSAYQSFVGIPFAEAPINKLRFAVSKVFLSKLLSPPINHYLVPHSLFLLPLSLLEPPSQAMEEGHFQSHSKPSALHPDELPRRQSGRLWCRRLPLPERVSTA